MVHSFVPIVTVVLAAIAGFGLLARLMVHLWNTGRWEKRKQTPNTVRGARNSKSVFVTV